VPDLTERSELVFEALDLHAEMCEELCFTMDMQPGDWQKKVDERIRSTMESLSPLSGLEKEVRALAQRLADLEKRLEERD